ncbi:MAG: HTH-type transcriptional regulator MalT [Anaerolineae bacterium]|nr:HTH-type transcriptional regulator MalT [Anaerolineae bacterium]
MINNALAGEVIDDTQLKHNYPWIDFIGLVGFDTKRRQFVLVETKTQTTHSRVAATLSNREQDVLQLVVMGHTNAQIAQKLIIAESTVKRHLRKIFAKLKVQSRTEAAMYAVWRGWAKGHHHEDQ